MVGGRIDVATEDAILAGEKSAGKGEGFEVGFACTRDEEWCGVGGVRWENAVVDNAGQAVNSG